MPAADVMRTEARDYYEVLGAEPSASTAELRAAFRDAVLRHHPDRAALSDVATRRTSVLNRAWTALRDPVRRLHYDRDLELGREETLDWPLDEAESHRPPRRRARLRVRPEAPSPWHQPQWRSVDGFRVPAEVFMAGPVAQERWIVEHHITGEDWRDHTEQYWLRFAARHYAEHGQISDWLGALERMLEQEPPLSEIVQAGLREAYITAGEELRGAMVVASIASRHPPGSPRRSWADRELRVLLGEYREQHVRRGPVAERAENAELLLNFLESLGVEPTFTDVRAAIVAHRRAGHDGRAAELVERAMAVPVTDAGRWFSLVQLLTEAGQLDRASTLLAEIARGEHPEALDPRRVHGPWRRIATARERLARARRRLG
jgi:curved DNA-binding protein CbpA